MKTKSFKISEVNQKWLLIDAENKIGYLETVVDYIKGVIKSVDNRGWDIKNAIEWKKFEAGVTY